MINIFALGLLSWKLLFFYDIDQQQDYNTCGIEVSRFVDNINNNSSNEILDSFNSSLSFLDIKSYLETQGNIVYGIQLEDTLLVNLMGQGVFILHRKANKGHFFVGLGLSSENYLYSLDSERGSTYLDWNILSNKITDVCLFVDLHKKSEQCEQIQNIINRIDNRYRFISSIY